MHIPSISNKTYSIVFFGLADSDMVTNGERYKFWVLQATGGVVAGIKLGLIGGCTRLVDSISTLLPTTMSPLYPRDPKAFAVPFRRRRFTFFIILLVGILFFLFVPWELPSSFQDLDFSSISRAKVAQLMKSKKAPVEEIYGLLHLVTGDHEQEHVLSNAVHLDPTVPLDLSIYAAGDATLNWHKERESLNEEYPIIIFSKVCVYETFLWI